MLKALPCDTCGPRYGKSAALPGDELYASAFAPRMPYKCARCKTKTRVTGMEFNRLPWMTLDEMVKHGLAKVILQDLPGTTIEQLGQMHAAGVHLAALHDQTGRGEPDHAS